jgi:hypothetical protein
MKNFSKVLSGLSMSALMLVSSFAFTACNDDDLNTNPYNKSGVNLVAMGPLPVSRLDQIRITGTQLNKVDKIIFPAESGVGEVDVTDFTIESDEEIKVTVPDASIPGHLKLVAGNDTITSLSLLTFVEPIEVTKVSPLDNLNAGDIITVDGEYVYNIATATFTDGVVVEAPEFVYTSRKQVKIAVPKEAVSGTLVLSDGDENDPQEFTYNLTINSAAITSLDRDASAGQMYEFGDQMILKGHNLDLVETVTFPSNIDVPFTVNADGTQITVTVPEDCCSGEVQVTQFSGLKTDSPAYVVPTIAVTSINGVDATVDGAALNDLYAGDKVTIKGQYLKRVKEFYFPNAEAPATADQYTILNDNTIEFTVPEDMTDGTITLVQNASISVSTMKLSMKKFGDVVWTGNAEFVGWSGNFGIYTWSGDDWTYWTGDVFNAVGTLTLTFTKTSDPAYLKLTRSGDWSTPFDNVASDPRFDASSGALLLEGDVSSVSFEVTEADLKDIQASGFTFYGSGITLTMIEYSKGGKVIWSGKFDNTGWGGNQDLAWGGYDWSTVSAGQTLTLTGYMTDTSAYGGWGCISLRHGQDWGNLPNSAGGQLDWGTETTSCSLDLTQDIIDDLVANGGLVITGDNITVTEVSIK